MAPLRFLQSSRRSQYSVWHGDELIGHVTKIVHRHTERGVTRTIASGWTPSIGGLDLAIQKTRAAAAAALWRVHQGMPSRLSPMERQ